MLREAEKNPNFIKLEIIDPTDTVKCIYCKKEMSKKDPNTIMINNGKYAHKECQEIEEKREKTDEERLNLYIQQLFNVNYVPPRIQKQITKFLTEYNYTYSGMLKALKYFYEIKGNDITKAHESIGIIPYIYQDAYNYYYELWVARQKNADVKINLYIPQIKEIKIKPPKVEVKKRKLFSFLDEEEEENQ